MVEYRQWKSEEESRLLEAKRAQEAALDMVEKERAKCRAAIEAAEKAKQIAEIEAQMRIKAEKRAMEVLSDWNFSPVVSQRLREKYQLCMHIYQCIRFWVQIVLKLINSRPNYAQITLYCVPE